MVGLFVKNNNNNNEICTVTRGTILRAINTYSKIEPSKNKIMM